MDSYLNSAAKSYLSEKEKNQTKGHRCIAALICHPDGEEPFVAVLCELNIMMVNATQLRMMMASLRTPHVIVMLKVFVLKLLLYIFKMKC